VRTSKDSRLGQAHTHDGYETFTKRLVRSATLRSDDFRDCFGRPGLQSRRLALQIGGLQCLFEDSKLAGFCNARLQAGTLESSRCPPEGGRYMNQNLVFKQTLQPPKLQRLTLGVRGNTNGRAEARPS